MNKAVSVFLMTELMNDTEPSGQHVQTTHTLYSPAQNPAVALWEV